MENGCQDTPLFDENLLKDLDWESRRASYKNNVTPQMPGEFLLLRPLASGDYERGLMQVLGQLTKVGDVDQESFQKRFESMKSCPDTYYVVVVEDTRTNTVIGCASLIVEQKFIRSTATRGRIEDVVVSFDYRGQQLGKLLVETLTLLGKELGCYKMSLECKEENIPFYRTIGYDPDGQYFMVLRYKD